MKIRNHFLDIQIEGSTFGCIKLSEQDTYSTLLQSTQLTNEYQMATPS